MTGYFYAYSAVSVFRALTGYLRASNDTALLRTAEPWLRGLAGAWRAYALPGSYLPDYCRDPNCYLECVPTYVHAVAGLVAANAYMARELGDLEAARGNASGAAGLREEADAMAAEAIARLYVAQTNVTGGGGGAAAEGAGAPPPPGDVGGWWAALDTASGNATEVRHVIDLGYTSLGFCNAGRGWPCALAGARAAQMADFALRQLILPSGAWMRALSLNDSLHRVDRPDHGTSGAYDAWPAMTFEALTVLAGGFDASIQFLTGVAGVAREGPLGQAHEVTPDGAGAYKTSNGWTRYVANNGGAFVEVVLRTLFGYEPGWLAPAPPAAPALSDWPRTGLRGTLACIRAPGGGGLYGTATLTSGGVAYTWSAEGC